MINTYFAAMAVALILVVLGYHTVAVAIAAILVVAAPFWFFIAAMDRKRR